ncbi:lipin family protein [Pelomyxa schiedti]|nr:lipin family protein [Pelomyxa schiedti]
MTTSNRAQRMIDGMSGMLKVNPSNLSGAIDVLVVKKADGTLCSTPFYVRFGKMQILKPKDKQVSILIDGVLKPVTMQLSHTGEAYFLEYETDTCCWEKPAVDVSEESTESTTAEYSICLQLLQDVDTKRANEIFDSQRVPHATIQSNPAILRNANGVFRINGKLYPGEVGLVMLASEPILGTSIPVSEITPQATNSTSETNGAPQSSSSGNAIECTMTSSPSTPSASPSAPSTSPSTPSTSPSAPSTSPSTPSPSPSTPSTSPITPLTSSSTPSTSPSTLPLSQSTTSNTSTSTVTPLSISGSGNQDTNTTTTTSSTSAATVPPSPTASTASASATKVKTQRPSTSLLAQLNLKPGMNHVTFSVTNGTSIRELYAAIYLVTAQSKLVVTDVDGTVTKSDFRGQLFTYLGQDWLHKSVAQLFTNISQNGYTVVYLTSRPIGQARQTRDFITSVTQTAGPANFLYTLPMGPIFTTPFRLFDAVDKEMIHKRPEVYKVECLQDIVQLFPENTNPIVAGFGNKKTDQSAYQIAGVPEDKIFLINSREEVEVHSVIKQGYTDLNSQVNDLFPPIPHSD